MEIINEGDKIVAVLSGELDHHGLAPMRTAIDAEINNSLPELLVLDLSGISFMDSSGIGLILGRMRLMASYGGKVKVRGAPAFAERIIKLAGLASVIETAQTAAQEVKRS